MYHSSTENSEGSILLKSTSFTLGKGFELWIPTLLHEKKTRAVKNKITGFIGLFCCSLKDKKNSLVIPVLYENFCYSVICIPKFSGFLFLIPDFDFSNKINS
jgi:hypothetical protein